MNYFFEKKEEVKERTEKIKNFLTFVGKKEENNFIEFPVKKSITQEDIDGNLQELTLIVEEFKEKAGINKAIRQFYKALPLLIMAMKKFKERIVR